jgi:sodium-independent sulfate anion transporter 11
VKVHSLLDDQIIGDSNKTASDHGTFTKSGGALDDIATRHIYVPFEHEDGSNPHLEVHTPFPGVFIYRFNEGFNYPNANAYLDQLTNALFAQTRRTNLAHYPRPGDRPWNDPGPRRGKAPEEHMDRPTLKAIILDFSAVNNVDITSVQQLIDVRNQLDRYTAPSVVDWHFANIGNRWTKRALVAAGFGYPTLGHADGSVERWKPIFSVSEIGGSDSAANAAEQESNEKEIREQRTRERERPTSGGDAIKQDSDSGHSSSDLKGGAHVRTLHRSAVVTGLNRPLFHVDITSALQSAIVNIKAREDYEERGGPGIGEIP